MALARLQHYLWGSDAIADYFNTRNGMLGPDYSTKFSAWLAQGCISPRVIAAEVGKYESQRTKNKSTYWVLFELLWRDYFRCAALCPVTLSSWWLALHRPCSCLPDSCMAEHGWKCGC